jgi:serine/threonine-protein kinase
VAGQLADVFVSYKAEDRPRVTLLVHALEEDGFSVWWDTHIGGGAHWREDIQEHLDAAKCVIVVWSSRSVGPGGDFVRDEATRARKRGVYLPVRFDPVEPPLGFGEVQAISLKGWRGDRSDGRFLTLAETVRKYVTGEHTDGHRAHYDEVGFSRRAVIAGVAGTGALAVAGVAGWLLLKPAPANTTRIAVLPFANLSGDPNQAYFSDGIAEELRSALTRIGMQVIGRTSSDAVKDMDAKTAAAKLDVANILTGSVRRSPETIRIDAELVSGKDGLQKWAQTYDRAPGDAIKIQTDIAQNVASALSIALGQAGRMALTLGGTADTVAQDLILQSRQLGRRGGESEVIRRRLALAEAAIARDPGYADAYVEKANMLIDLGANYAPTPAEAAVQFSQAANGARKAVALAPRLGSVHTALANVAFCRLDFTSVLRETKRSLLLSPDNPDVLGYGSQYLTELESAEEGLRLAERGIALDPFNGRFYLVKSQALILLRRYADAINAGKSAARLSPESRYAHIHIGDAFLLLGRPGQARTEYEALGDNPSRLLRLTLLAARTGDRAATERMIAQAKQQFGVAASYQYGEIYAQLGDRDGAFSEFDKAIEVKDAGLVDLKVGPFLDPIRSDPRYAVLLRRLNFP